MLCNECEKLLSKYEEAFKIYWFDSGALPERVDLSYQELRLTGAEYSIVKLFHLSVLWRTGAAEWCRNVSLGPHAARIASMLMSGNPGDRTCYPIVGSLLIGPEGDVRQVITEPLRCHWLGNRIYYMCYAGCRWHFVMDANARLPDSLGLAIEPNGDIFLPYMDSLDGALPTAQLQTRLKNLPPPRSRRERQRKGSAQM